MELKKNTICNECHDRPINVVIVGNPENVGYEGSGICQSCLEKALALIKEGE